MDEPVIGTPSGEYPPEPSAEEARDAERSAAASQELTMKALRVGTAAQVAYAGASRGPAFIATVAGVTPEALALDLGRGGRPPTGPGQGEPLLLVVRHEQPLVFESTTKAFDPARSLLIVAPPVEARRPELRGSVRASVAVPLRSGVWLDPEGAESPIQSASVTDVSEGGLQLRSLRHVGTGSLVRLVFVLHPAERPVHVQGIVVDVREEPRTSALRVHVQFVEMSADSRDQIKRFVARATARGRTAA